MKRLIGHLLRALTLLAIAGPSFAHAQAQHAPQHTFPNAPQDFVVCTGWHALCTASPDCKRNGNWASCDCMRVNETHIVATAEIRNTEVKRLTDVKCTNAHPCEVDQAPICDAIKNGYEENNVKYQWVSTYSYRGWCALLASKPIACDPTVANYVGDSSYAVCDIAPCTEIKNPVDPNRPLSCQCRAADNEAFVGMNGSCTGVNGGIMSSMPTWAWDFQNNTYPFPMPGYEFVQDACAPLGSDPVSVSSP